MERFIKRIGGFTLVEMMVTVAIIAILATVAIGRYDQLKVMAHRSEAKNALGMLGKLQEVYRIEKDKYYIPPAANALASAVKYGGTQGAAAAPGATDCGGNALGFKLKGCEEKAVRYEYYLDSATADGWIAVANTDKGKLGLTCSNVPSATATNTSPTHSSYTASGTARAASISVAGDTHYMTDRRAALVHANDIIQDCN